jgi:tetratricopeptide (TPR) repeat protein
MIAVVMRDFTGDLRRRLPGLAPPASSAGEEQTRFRLYDGLATFLLNASRREPLVVVLDHLHCADRGSLALLEFLAPQLGRARLLVVGTYRDSELQAHRWLVQTLGELARVQPPRRTVLRGLSRGEVARHVALTAGVEPDDALVEAIHTKSEGNPFFVAEIVRLLSAEERLESAAGEIAIPQEVRELIARRLAPLSPYCREALSIAGVVGRDFDLRVVQAVADVDAERLLEALEEAQAARVIAPTVEQLSTREPEPMRWITGLAYLHAELGRRDEAAAAFEPVASRGFAAIARDNQWLMRVATLADTCAFLGDVSRARELRELLLPYAERNVVMVDGWACLGSAARPLAVLVTTIGRWDDAEAHFRAAIDFNARLGASPWVARTQLGYGQMLFTRRSGGDLEHAHNLLQSALATARDLGMTTLAERAAAQLDATSA